MADITVYSPIDDRVVGRVPSMGTRDIDRAFAEAAKAQALWVARPLADRLKVLRKAAAGLRADAPALAKLLTVEIGKRADEAKQEVVRTADLIDQTVKEAVRVAEPEVQKSQTFPKTKAGRTQRIERHPWGTILAIAPFNYPVNLAATKIAPALAMGNAVILKPSTQGSVSGRRLAQVFYRAGVPKALLPVITGDTRKIGEYLVTHEGVGLVAMTGSTDVGKWIARRVEMVPTLLELGGNDPAIVLADADLDLAARDITIGAFRYAGQRCTAVKRVYVVNSVADELVAKIATQTDEHFGSVGDPHDHPLGPVISDHQALYLKQLLADAKRRKGKVIRGGAIEGRFAEATVIDKVPHGARLVQEEQFGPLLPIVRVPDAAEAVRLAEDTEYGLQACIFTKDLKQAEAIAAQLEVGGVHLNGPDQRAPDNFLFTGWKDSGLGDQGVRFSLEAMSRRRGVVHNPPTRLRRSGRAGRGK